MMNYKNRIVESLIQDIFKVFKICCITGPRQSGKSTLINHLFKSNWKYYSFDDRELLLRAKDDPALFIKAFHSNIAIDEAQKAPDLFDEIKKLVDEGFPHKIILSGSANFLLMKAITESLAGRTGILHVLPFSAAEAYERHSNNLIEKMITTATPENLFSVLCNAQKNSMDDEQLLNFILFGAFPKVHELTEPAHKWLWHENYISTYIEKDLRSLAHVGDLDAFQRVYKILALQSGSIINMSSIGQAIGIATQTVKHYISILQTSFHGMLLPAYLMNQRKQIIKAPKIMLADTGIINYFLQIDSIDKMVNAPQWGSILETHVVNEIVKQIQSIVPKPSLYYWRTNNGAEVDVVLQSGRRLIPMEIKSGVQIRRQSLRGLKSFIESQPAGSVPFGIVFYRGAETVFLDKNILAIPLGMLL